MIRKCLDCKNKFEAINTNHVRCGTQASKTGCAYKHRQKYWNSRYQLDPNYKESVKAAVKRYKLKQKENDLR